jgi:hypothetical protein
MPDSRRFAVAAHKRKKKRKGNKAARLKSFYKRE